MFRAWLQLARISNLPTIWTNVAAAWMLAGGAWQDPRLVMLIIAGSLLYTGGMILNDVADAEFDRKHRRERPIPAGHTTRRTAGIVAVVLLLLGSTLAVLQGASPSITAFLVAAIVFYDLYHKQWSGSVIIMGACRVLLALMAASAFPVDQHIGGSLGAGSAEAPRTLDLGFKSPAVIHVLPVALALGAYIIGITLAARREHQKGAKPSLMIFGALVLLYTPAVLFARRFYLMPMNPWPLVVLAIFALIVALATQLLRKGGPAIGKAVGLLLAGIVVVDALAVAAISINLALMFVCLMPVLLVWQRWIAAT